MKQARLLEFFFCILIPVFSYSNAFAGDTISSQQAVKILGELLRIRSVPGKEKPAGDYLLNISKQMGFSTRVFTESDSAFNFSLSLYPLSSNKPNIIFLCHIDVVPVTDSIGWRYPPFSGRLVNDTIWGRGCMDMKGAGLMQLMAVQPFIKTAAQKDLPYNVSVLFVSGEESGGKNGAGIIVEKYLAELNPSVVIGEGGGGLKEVLPSKPQQEIFFVSVAEKKSLWLKLSVQEPTHGHASIPSPEMANAVLLAAIDKLARAKPLIFFDKTAKHMFRGLGKLNGGFKGLVLRNINSWLLRPFRRKILQRQPLLLNEVTNTCQLTSIYNPSAPPNVIPGYAAAYYDCRLVPGIKTKKFIRKIRRCIGNPKVQIEIIDQSPAAKPSHTDEKFKAIKSALQKSYPGCEVLPVLFPATTDNSYFRSKNISAFGVIPVKLSRELIESVHGINECIPLASFLEGIDAYKIIIEEMIKSEESN